MGCNESKTDKKMNLTYWDETAKFKEIKKELTELRDMYANAMSTDDRGAIMVKYDFMIRNISEDMLDRWFSE